MKKKLHIIILGGVILYVAVFIVVMLITIFLPMAVYNNQELLSGNLNNANKMNYKLNRHDGITTVTCSKMQGMDTVWEYETAEDTERQMNYTFEVTSGKAKLVLIQPDDTVITLAEQDSAVGKGSQTSELSAADDFEQTAPTAESMVVLDLKEGNNRIKIVCEKGTSFSLSFEIQE